MIDAIKRSYSKIIFISYVLPDYSPVHMHTVVQDITVSPVPLTFIILARRIPCGKLKSLLL